METKLYGQNEVTGVTVSVQSGGTVAVSRGFSSTIGIAANMNTSEGTATAGEVVNVPAPSDAEDLFGAESELDELVRDAYNNGVYDIFAVGATESDTTETFDSVQSATLTSEIADPNVTSHEITATDTTAGSTIDVSAVYESPPSTPEAGANVNPVSREIEFSTSGTYEVSYTAQDMSSATDALAQQNIRFLAVASENEEVLNDALSVVNNKASQFDFKRVVGGANPRADPQNYSDGISDSRMVLVAPSRGYKGEAQTNETRTVGAVTGTLAARPLGNTATNEAISGFVSIQDYPDSDIAELDSVGLLTLHDSVEGIEIVRDMTTSTDERFERVYACEIVDDFAYTSYLVSRQFVGRLNTSDNRDELEKSLENVVYDARNTQPPLLDDGVVEVVNDGGADEVSANIGLDVVDVMDRIFVNIEVGPIMRGSDDENTA